MITPEYCVTMARYNGWQNRQLKSCFDALDTGALTKERGAFFGSILGTANHLLWGDRMWLNRFGVGEAPDTPPPGTDMTDGSDAWAVDRFRTDAALLKWAEGLQAIDLTGPLTWYSALSDSTLEKPLGLCIMHMFNHQTHHRGQIHAMLTAAGSDAPVSDIVFMPEEGPWL
ncbi:DinB family protein [Pacificoceanicola onchidii]|uniref:DinB family protein n=1 Tax=Pacificoceanicola onchidii TaxID=2562685 RepID=UPI0010A37035|nr:DinB family protein [Pacificoceanicola onchidii]